MAKTYVIELSPIDKMRDYTEEACPQCGRETKKSKEPLREVEKDIFRQVFNLASIDKEDIESTMLCYDCIDQVKHLSDDENILEFTEADLKLFAEGFKKTAGVVNRNGVDIIKRPRIWLDECYHIFSQLKRPKTKEEYIKEVKKGK